MKSQYLRGKLLGLWIALLVGAFLISQAIIFFNDLRTQSFNEDPTYWEADIADIEARYAGNYPQNAIVFIGSSSIRRWESLDEDMAPLPVLNHGFGGSKINDSTYYLDRLVFPFNPRAVVLFAGTNDINGVDGATKTGEQVYAGFVAFVDAIRAYDPALPIYYISISPTNDRWNVWSDAQTANMLIAEYAITQPIVTFIDATPQLLATDGTPNEELLFWDGLHLNAEGYAVWASIIKPVIEADLN